MTYSFIFFATIFFSIIFFNISFEALIGYRPVIILPFLCGISLLYLKYGTACFFSMTLSKIALAFSILLFLINLHISTDCFVEIFNDAPLAIASILFHRCGRARFSCTYSWC